MSSMAFAADMPIAPPPMVDAPPVEDFGGWYLRGDIGFSNQERRTGLRTPSYAVVVDQTSGFDTAGIFGIGVGYQFNNWFRVDVTGQYRGRSNFHGLDVFSSCAMRACLLPASTPTREASLNGWLSPTAMWISVPGGA